MKRLRGMAGLTTLWIGLSVWNPPLIAQAPGRARASGLTVEDVIKLAKAGLSEDIIVQQVKRKGQAFDLSSDQIIELKAAHVSDWVVEVMLDPAKADVPAPGPPMPLARAEAPPPAVSAPQPAAPTEVGVYARKQDQWVEVAPEIVYWKTAGALKTIATAGLRHGDGNGHVPGLASHTSFAAPLEFLVVAPEGVALAEYRLLRLRRGKQDREFRTVTGLLHSQSGESRDMLTFDSKKVANRVYEVSFPSSAGPGEYGLLPPPGSTYGDGKIYSFRIVVE